MAPDARSPEALASTVERIVAVAGPDLRVAAPLGLGKPHRLLNALYRRVGGDDSLSLSIFTALSLTPPRASGDLERRFLDPFVLRFFGADFESLDYVQALRQERLPPNIHVEEFYLQSGALLTSRQAQRGHANVNYTHVARGVAAQDINVLVQKVAREPGGQRLSLSCNPDLTLDLVDEIALRGKPRPWLVAEVDPHLPWMGGTAAVDGAYFDHVLELPSTAPRLFALPRQPVSDEDYAIGLYASALVRDGGTLQIGIGTLSDALAQALLLRHRQNAAYLELLESLEPGYAESALVREVGGTGPFERGLYGASEMVNDAFRVLRQAGILVRRVVDDIEVMERLDAGTANSQDRALLEREGRFLDGAFYLGSVDLYRWLRELSPAEARGIGMTRVSHINHLHGGQERLERAQRKDARFFNTCMLMTALGAAASDTLEDGRVVSGVGGQYNFVAMAHELRDARSVLMFRSMHGAGSRRSSNIRWSYGNATIPRHLRDLAITEYGVADLRDRSDEHCARALIAIAAAPFQRELLAQAKRSKKVARDASIAPDATPNEPAALARRLGAARRSGLLPDYPLGCDFTPVEQRLAHALGWMRAATTRRFGTARLLASALAARLPEAGEELRRMGWSAPRGLKERLLARALRLALRETTAGAQGQI
jgi:acyl-CoA hydrolase